MDSPSFLSGLSEFDKAAGHGEYGRTITLQVLDASARRVRARFGGPGCPWRVLPVPMPTALVMDRDDDSVKVPLRSTELAFAPARDDSIEQEEGGGADTPVEVAMDVLRAAEQGEPTTLAAAVLPNGHEQQPRDDGAEAEKPFSVCFRWSVGAHLRNVAGTPATRLPEVLHDSGGKHEDGEEEREKQSGPVHFHVPSLPPPAEIADGSPKAPTAASHQVNALVFEEDAGEPDTAAGTEEQRTHEVPADGLSPSRQQAPLVPAAPQAGGPGSATRSDAPTASDGAVASLPRQDTFEARATSSTHSSRRARPPSRRRSCHMVVDIIPPEAGGRISDIPFQGDPGANTESRSPATQRSEESPSRLEGGAAALPASEPFVVVSRQALASVGATAVTPRPADPPSAARQLDFATAQPPMQAAPLRSSIPPTPSQPAKAAPTLPTAENLFDGAPPDATVAMVEVLSVQSSASAAPGRIVTVAFSLKSDAANSSASVMRVHQTHRLSRAKAACVPQVSVPFLLPEELAADPTLPVLCEAFEVVGGWQEHAHQQQQRAVGEGSGGGGGGMGTAAEMPFTTTLLWTSTEEVTVSAGSPSFGEPVLVSFTSGSDTVTTRWSYSTVGAYRERVLNMRADVASAAAADAGSTAHTSGTPYAQLQVLVEMREAQEGESGAVHLWLSQPTTGISAAHDAAFQSATVHVGEAVQPIVLFNVRHAHCVLSLAIEGQRRGGGGGGGAEQGTAISRTCAIPFADMDCWHKAELISNGPDMRSDPCANFVVHYRFIHERSHLDVLPSGTPSTSAARHSKHMCELRIRVRHVRLPGGGGVADDAATAAGQDASRHSASRLVFTNTPLRVGGRAASPIASPSTTNRGRAPAPPFYRLALYDGPGGALHAVSRVFSQREWPCARTEEAYSKGKDDGSGGGGGDSDSDSDDLMFAQSFFFASSTRIAAGDACQQLHVVLLCFATHAEATQFSPARPSSASDRMAADVVLKTSSLLAAAASRRHRRITSTLCFAKADVTAATLAEGAMAAPCFALAQLCFDARPCGADRPDTAVFQVQSVRVLDVPTSAAAVRGRDSAALTSMSTRLWFAPSMFTEQDVEAAYARACADEGQQGRAPEDPRDWALNTRWPLSSPERARAAVACMDCAVAGEDRALASTRRTTLFTSSTDLRLCVALLPQPAPAPHSEPHAHTSLLDSSGMTAVTSPGPAFASAAAAPAPESSSRRGATASALDLLRRKVHHLRKSSWRRHQPTSAREENSAEGRHNDPRWAEAVLAADEAVALQVDNYAEVDLTPSVSTGCGGGDVHGRRLFEGTVVGQIRMNHRIVVEIRGAWLKVPVTPPVREVPVKYQPSPRLWAIRGSFVRRAGLVEAMRSLDGAPTDDEASPAVVSPGGSTLMQSSTCDLTVTTYPIDYTDPSPNLVAESLPGVSPDLFVAQARRQRDAERQPQHHQSPQLSPPRPVKSGNRPPQRGIHGSPSPSVPHSPQPPSPSPSLVAASSPYEARITTADPSRSGGSEAEALLHVSVDEAVNAAQQSSTNPSFLMSVLQRKELRARSRKSCRVCFLFGDAYTTRTCATAYSAEYHHRQTPSLVTARGGGDAGTVLVAPATVMDATQSNGISTGRGTFRLDDAKFFGISHSKFAPVLEWFHGDLGVPLDVEEGRRAAGARLWRSRLQESDLGAQRRPQASLAITAIAHQPLPRAAAVSSHSLTRCGDSGFFLFGGCDNMNATSARAAFCRSEEPTTWGSFQMIPSALSDGDAAQPAARQGHSAVYRPADGSVYVYGGNRSSSSRWDRLALLGDVWSISLHDGVAKRVVCDASRVEQDPRAGDLHRWRHIAVSHDDVMIVVGGQCVAHDLSEGSDPSSHSSTEAKQRVVVAPCSPLLCLDLRTHAWETRSSFCRHGDIPCPRFGHTAAVVADASMYMYGGRGAGDELLNDLSQLDLLTRMWTSITPNGAVAPPPLELASMAAADVTGTPCLFLVGGRGSTAEAVEEALSVYMFSTATHFWRRVGLTCGPIEQRCAARLATLLPPAEGMPAARQHRQRKGLPEPCGTATAQLLLVGGSLVNDGARGAPPPRSSAVMAGGSVNGKGNWNGDEDSKLAPRHVAGACVMQLSSVPPRAPSSARGQASRPARVPARMPSAALRSSTSAVRAAVPTPPPPPRHSSSAPPRRSVLPPHPPSLATSPSARRTRQHHLHRHHVRDSAEGGDTFEWDAAVSGPRQRPMSASEVARCIQRLSAIPPASRVAIDGGGSGIHQPHDRCGIGHRSASASAVRHRREAKSAFSTLTRDELRDQVDRLYYQGLQHRQVLRERGGDGAAVPPPTRVHTPPTVQCAEALPFERSHRQSQDTDDTAPTGTRAVLHPGHADDDRNNCGVGGGGADVEDGGSEHESPALAHETVGATSAPASSSSSVNLSASSSPSSSARRETETHGSKPEPEEAQAAPMTGDDIGEPHSSPATGSSRRSSSVASGSSAPPPSIPAKNEAAATAKDTPVKSASAAALGTPSRRSSPQGSQKSSRTHSSSSSSSSSESKKMNSHPGSSQAGCEAVNAERKNTTHTESLPSSPSPAASSRHDEAASDDDPSEVDVARQPVREHADESRSSAATDGEPNDYGADGFDSDDSEEGRAEATLSTGGEERAGQHLRDVPPSREDDAPETPMEEGEEETSPAAAERSSSSSSSSGGGGAQSTRVCEPAEERGGAPAAEHPAGGDSRDGDVVPHAMGDDHDGDVVEGEEAAIASPPASLSPSSPSLPQLHGDKGVDEKDEEEEGTFSAATRTTAAPAGELRDIGTLTPAELVRSDDEGEDDVPAGREESDAGSDDGVAPEMEPIPTDAAARHTPLLSSSSPASPSLSSVPADVVAAPAVGEETEGAEPDSAVSADSPSSRATIGSERASVEAPTAAAAEAEPREPEVSPQEADVDGMNSVEAESGIASPPEETVSSSPESDPVMHAGEKGEEDESSSWTEVDDAPQEEVEPMRSMESIARSSASGAAEANADHEPSEEEEGEPEFRDDGTDEANQLSVHSRSEPSLDHPIADDEASDDLLILMDAEEEPPEAKEAVAVAEEGKAVTHPDASASSFSSPSSALDGTRSESVKDKRESAAVPTSAAASDYEEERESAVYVARDAAAEEGVAGADEVSEATEHEPVVGSPVKDSEMGSDLSRHQDRAPDGAVASAASAEVNPPTGSTSFSSSRPSSHAGVAAAAEVSENAVAPAAPESEEPNAAEELADDQDVHSDAHGEAEASEAAASADASEGVIDDGSSEEPEGDMPSGDEVVGGGAVEEDVVSEPVLANEPRRKLEEGGESGEADLQPTTSHTESTSLSNPDEAAASSRHGSSKREQWGEIGDDSDKASSGPRRRSDGDLCDDTALSPSARSQRDRDEGEVAAASEGEAETEPQTPRPPHVVSAKSEAELSLSSASLIRHDCDAQHIPPEEHAAPDAALASAGEESEEAAYERAHPATDPVASAGSAAVEGAPEHSPSAASSHALECSSSASSVLADGGDGAGAVAEDEEDERASTPVEADAVTDEVDRSAAAAEAEDAATAGSLPNVHESEDGHDGIDDGEGSPAGSAHDLAKDPSKAEESVSWHELGDEREDSADAPQPLSTAKGDMRVGGTSSSSSLSSGGEVPAAAAVSSPVAAPPDSEPQAEEHEEEEEEVGAASDVAALSRDPSAEPGDEDRDEEQGDDNDSRDASEAATTAVRRDLLDRKQGVEEAIDDDDFNF